MEVFTLLNTATAVGDGDALTMLRRSLEIARLQVGRPTYRRISTGCGLSASTICRIFKAAKPPAWDNLTRVLTALGIDADADPKWRELWLNAENATSPIPVELEDGLVVPGRRNCPSCGTWIADSRLHTEHHELIDRLTNTVQQLEWQIATLAVTASARHEQESDRPQVDQANLRKLRRRIVPDPRT